MKHNPRGLLRRTVGLGAVVFAGLALTLAPAASAAGVSGGSVVPSPTSGGKTTPFNLTLVPFGSACSGDSATQGYHVFSYNVPVATDPASLTFNSQGPSSGYPLFDQTQTPYTAQNTAPNTGQIVNLPTFDFSLFDSSVQPTGDYHVGIACANTLGQGDKFWDVVLHFGTDDASSSWWTALTNPEPAGGSSLTGVVAAAGVAGVAGAVALRRRRSKAAVSV